MSANDRVDLFLDTQTTLTNSINNIKKVTTEINKLCQWIQKHQNELLTDTCKGKLLFIIEKYYLYNKNSNSNNNDDDSKRKLVEVIEKLLSDFLALPEGKLCSSKGKQKVMNWQCSMMETTSSSSSSNSNRGNSNSSNNIERWIICDVNGNLISLMKSQSESDELIEDVCVTNIDILTKINSIYDGDSDQFAQIDYDRINNIILRIYDEEGNEL